MHQLSIEDIDLVQRTIAQAASRTPPLRPRKSGSRLRWKAPLMQALYAMPKFILVYNYNIKLTRFARYQNILFGT